MWLSLRESEDGAGLGGYRKEEGSKSMPRFLAGMNWVDSVGTFGEENLLPKSFERKE